MLKTQISGKYSPENPSLFRFKDALKLAGVEVRHPISDTFHGRDAGTYFAFETKAKTFREIEGDFYSCVANCTFHSIANDMNGRSGYLGVSAARETAWAMLHHKPILALYDPRFAEAVEPKFRQLIERNWRHVRVIGMLDLRSTTTLDDLPGRGIKVAYDIPERESRYVRSRVDDFFSEM